ncbi:MAG: YaiI/YqxD family protein [Gammaproteobacteria bacterium]|nr:YaiI/YqxD family protein [Gammaproteobacteria bacterium]
MKILVDADACPNPVKEILFRAADKRAVETLLVANQRVNVPPSPNIRAIQVPKGFDVADNEIVQRAEPGDLIITADIPLASAVIDKGAFALNPRGEFYTTENIRQRLNMRDFMETLRSSGIQSGGPPPLTQQDRQAFANALDRFLTKNS